MVNKTTVHKALWSGLFVTALAICCSCNTNYGNDLIIMKSTEVGLLASTKNTQSQTFEFYSLLESNLADPRTHERAAIWQPKAQSFQQQKNEIMKDVENVKNKPGDLEGWQKLYKGLDVFKEAALDIDVKLRSNFNKQADQILSPFDSVKTRESDIDFFFKNSSAESKKLLIAKIENSIVLLEDSVAGFCYENTFFNRDFITITVPLINQNKSFFKPGEELEITVGVGAYSVMARPKVHIDGKLIQLEYNAIANYKLKIPDQKGKHFKKVQVDYKDEFGIDKSRVFRVVYTVEQ